MTRIEIRFITNEEYEADEESKERVVIKLIGEDTFSHVYTGPCDEGRDEYKKTAEYNKEQLMAWFRGTLRLAVIAIDSFKAFLFYFPNLPPFKIPPKKLNTEDQFDSLLDLFSEQLDILDNGPRSGSRSSSTSSSEDEDEETESVTSSHEDPIPSPSVEEESEPGLQEAARPQEIAVPSVLVAPSMQEVAVSSVIVVPSVQEVVVAVPSSEPEPRRSTRIRQQGARV